MFKTFTIAAILLVITIGAKAQGPVHWSVKSQTPIASAKAGAKLTVQVTARIDNGWYIYSITQPKGGPTATQISILPRQSFRLAGRISGPRPHNKFDEGFGINTETYTGSAVFSLVVALAPVSEKPALGTP